MYLITCFNKTYFLFRKSTLLKNNTKILRKLNRKNAGLVYLDVLALLNLTRDGNKLNSLSGWQIHRVIWKIHCLSARTCFAAILNGHYVFGSYSKRSLCLWQLLKSITDLGVALSVSCNCIAPVPSTVRAWDGRSREKSDKRWKLVQNCLPEKSRISVQ